MNNQVDGESARSSQRFSQEDLMRKELILATVIVTSLGASLPAASAPRDNARAIALADCNRQARAMQFGRRAIQRRNFVKDCMIDRGFPAQVN